MKKFLLLLSMSLLLGTITISSSSCQRGSGCPGADAASVRTDKKGKLSTKRGNSNLFPKHMRKRNR